MRIGRAFFVPVVLALTTAAAILAGSAAPVAAAQAPAAHAHSSSSGPRPEVRYHV